MKFLWLLGSVTLMVVAVHADDQPDTSNKNCVNIKVRSKGPGDKQKKDVSVNSPDLIFVKKLLGGSAECKEGKSYFLRNQKVIVKDGCKAEFTVCGPKDPVCKNVNLKGKDGDKKKEKKVNQLDKIAFMEIASQKGGDCRYGETYGFMGNTVWASHSCDCKFKVCDAPEPLRTVVSDKEKNYREKRKDLMKEMFGEPGESTADVRNKLKDKKKKAYNGKCVCSVYGDPHFLGFDGGVLHFQGVCEYTVAHTTSEFPGCDFDITVENENRDKNTAVSFVKKVHIRMFGQDIVMSKNNVVMVNGDKQGDYVSLQGKYTIQAGGTNSKTFNAKECGVQVTYRNNHRVDIVVDKKYAGRMSGMCGNCDGTDSNDYRLANGEEPSDPNKRNSLIGNSFSVGKCEITEQSKQCRNDASLKRAEQICEPLRDENGPFRNCIHNTKSGKIKFFESCLTDICAFIDDKEKTDSLRCQMMSVMAEACFKEGEMVHWRYDTKCPLTCPRNSKFFEFVPNCQPSCAEANPQGSCLMDTSEGCICKKDFVIMNNKCVKSKNCGCKRGKNLFEIGESFLNRRCTKLFTCEEKNGKPKIKTSDYKCDKNGHCKKVEGVRQCVCNKNYVGDGKTCTIDQDAIDKENEQRDKDREDRNKKTCTCNPWGDPHYKQFDGASLHFQGACTYLVSGTSTLGDGCDFSVKAKNERRAGKKGVTFLQHVYIEFNGMRVDLKKGKVLKVNGITKTTPWKKKVNDKTIEVITKGKFIEFGVDECNLFVSFDGNMKMYVRVPKDISDHLTGLCGDCDGKKNEWFTKDGTNVNNKKDKFSLIGNSFKVPNPEGLVDTKECDQEEPAPECSKETMDKVKTKEQCGRLIDRGGVFGDCIKKGGITAEELQDMYEGCLLDACTFQDDKPALDNLLCGANEELATTCMKNGVTVDNWRTKDFCPWECDDTSFYTPRMFGCQPSCTQLEIPETCDREEVEGCQCNEGLVLDNGKCIDPEDCGCKNPNDGTYLPRGVSTVSEDCSTLFTCEALENGGSILSNSDVGHARCDHNAHCDIDNQNNAVCTCNEGYMGDGYQCDKVPEPSPSPSPVPFPSPPEGATCSCMANGDPRVVQFDGGKVQVYDPCKFTLARAINQDSECWFAVEMKAIISTHHTHQSYIESVDIILPDSWVRLGSNMQVWFRDPSLQFMFPGGPPPFSLLNVITETMVTDRTKVVLEANAIHVQTACGVKVTYDGKGETTVLIPEKYAKNNDLMGLCGDCDGNWKNDRTDKFGKMPEEYSDKVVGFNNIARMHIVNDDSFQPDLSDVCQAPEA